MTRREKINARFSAQIADAARRFSDHESMNRKQVIKWMEQFEDGHLECGIKLLQNVRYYSASQIRQMLRTMVQLVY